MQRVPRQKALEYLFDGRKQAVLRVRRGERFAVETEDAFSGLVRTVEDVRRSPSFAIKQVTPGLGNPMAGPIHVEGAEKGDVLVVHIEQITVDDLGRSRWTRGQGPLGDSKRHPTLGEPFLQEIRHIPGPSGTTRDGKGVLNDRVSWDLKPFIGTIGVAPEVEVVTSSIGQGCWGGNIDCRDMNEGTTAFIPVFHDGALLFVGDVHASQGDTEFYGSADESRSELVLSCDVIKGKKIPYIRLENEHSLISLFCYRPLEDAVEAAIVNLMEWLVADYGVSVEEAYVHTCVNPDFRVNVYQMVRIDALQYTVGAQIPRRYFG